PMARAAESRVPSPPSTITSSAPSGTSSRGRPTLEPAYPAVSVSSRVRTPFRSSQAISSGTMRAAWLLEGLDMIRAVLTAAIQQKLAVPRGSQEGAFDDIGPKSLRLDSGAHAGACLAMQHGVAHNPSFANLFLAYFKLRFHQDHYFST